MRWFIFILIYTLIDLYALQAIRTLTKNFWITGIYILISLVVIISLYFLLNSNSSTHFSQPPISYLFGLFLALFIPKLLIIIFMFGEDMIRLLTGFYFKISASEQNFHIPSRRKFISTLALGIAAIPFSTLLYGMIKGKYNFKVLKYELEFTDLPDAFDGFTMTQISDIHSGSFDNKNKINYAIDLINKQKSDVIFFTGDLVNNVADEMDSWKELFSGLRAKEGVFSVLGNHDYGDYRSWPSEKEKIDNFTKIKQYQKDIGFELLINDSKYIQRGIHKLAIVGVENWGNGFRKYGDLSKASEKIQSEDFKILLSHDPTHWQKKVLIDNTNYQLTLSGHTHGGQFGIEIPGHVKWSPVSWRYKYWAGIYKEKNKYLNVNRGLGTTAVPGRLGVWPEITVITLKSTNNA